MPEPTPEPLAPARGQIIGGDFEPGAHDSPLRGFMALGDERIAMIVAVPPTAAIANRTVVVEEATAWDRRVRRQENLIAALIAAGMLIIGLFGSAVYLAHQRDDAQARPRTTEIPTCAQLNVDGYDGTAPCIDAGGYTVAPGEASARAAWKRYEALEAAWQICERYDLWHTKACQDTDGTDMDRPIEPSVPRPGS